MIGTDPILQLLGLSGADLLPLLFALICTALVGAVAWTFLFDSPR